MQDGIKIITERLSEKYHKIQCNAKVVAVYPDKVFYLLSLLYFYLFTTQATNKVIVEHENGKKEIYDHVVLATEAYSALKLLKDSSSQLKQGLQCFPFEVINRMMDGQITLN